MKQIVTSFTESGRSLCDKMGVGVWRSLSVAGDRSYCQSMPLALYLRRLSIFPSPMTVTELFPALKGLNRADKLKVMQFLIAELASDEELTLEPGATYEVWSPFNSHQAAHQLAELLESESPNSNA